MRKLTQEEWISKAKYLHGDLYDYSKSIYKGGKSPVVIICRSHGEFLQEASSHAHSGAGCPHCGGTMKMNTEQWIVKAQLVHGDKYDYSLVKYLKRHSDVEIICKVHGAFIQGAGNHLKGHGCAKCTQGPGKGRKALYNTEEWVQKARKVHGDLYDYSESIYEGNHKKVQIICKTHGVFEKLAIDHVSGGQGCQSCAKSGFKTDQPAFLYLLRSSDGKFAKIGISNNYLYRTRKLKRVTPFSFELVELIRDNGAKIRWIETLLHKSQTSARFSGFDGCTEWFFWDDSILQIINEVKECP